MVPGSLPVMFAGLKTAAGLSLVGAVVGEFISAERGLGVLVQQFASQLAMADAFAVILMLMFIGLSPVRRDGVARANHRLLAP